MERRGVADHFFRARLGSQPFSAAAISDERVSQLLQGGCGQGGILPGGYGGRGTGEIQLRGGPADFVLQLQDDPLGQLFAHALGHRQGFFISVITARGKALRPPAERMGQGGFGVYAADAQKAGNTAAPREAKPKRSNAPSRMFSCTYSRAFWFSFSWAAV